MSKDLSDAARVAQGLLYHYFRSKEELLQAVLDQHYFLPELRRGAAADRDRPAAEVLLELARGFASMLDEKRSFVQLMLREAPSNSLVAERLDRTRAEEVRVVADYLASRVAAGELRPHDCEAARQFVVHDHASHPTRIHNFRLFVLRHGCQTASQLFGPRLCTSNSIPSWTSRQVIWVDSTWLMSEPE